MPELPRQPFQFGLSVLHEKWFLFGVPPEFGIKIALGARIECRSDVKN
jgi:hypothetical protein